MYKDYNSVDPRAIKEDAKAVVSSSFENDIKNRINEYREQGFSEDEILTMLFDECSRPVVKKEVSKQKTKTISYYLNFYQK